MKILATLSLLTILTSSMAFAGGFGGPGPFRNNSPLPTGTDGRYQAVAKATNLTGIFGFEIRNGVQSTAANFNRWVFFVDGQVISGNTVANVSQGKVNGILDSEGAGGIPTNDDGTVDLPVVTVIPGNSAAGSFSGSMSMNSSMASFSGNGLVQGIPSRTDQIIFITEGQVTALAVLPPSIIVQQIVIPGGNLQETKFRFNGTRLTTTTSFETPATTTN